MEEKKSNIGKTIKGYCNGYFGRDDYEDKIIIDETTRAICCKYLDNDFLTIANFDSEEEKNWCIHQWEQGKSMYQDKGYMSN